MNSPICFCLHAAVANCTYMPPHKVELNFKAPNLHDRISDCTMTFAAIPILGTKHPKSVQEGPGFALLQQLPTFCFITVAAALCDLRLNPSTVHFYWQPPQHQTA